MIKNSEYAQEYELINSKYDTTIISNISDLINSQKYNYGDLIHFSFINYLESFFVGKDGKLIRNNDITEEGNLIIPYEITRHLDDALEKYKLIKGWYMMELDHRDKTLLKYLKNVNKNYLYYIIQNYYNKDLALKVLFPNNNYRVFEIQKTSMDDIDKFYKGSLLPQIKITVILEINKYSKEKIEYLRKKMILPNVWTRTLQYLYDENEFLRKCIEFIGPEKEKKNLISLLNSYFSPKNILFTYEIQNI